MILKQKKTRIDEIIEFGVVLKIIELMQNIKNI
jgi:hypothetical protein